MCMQDNPGLLVGVIQHEITMCTYMYITPTFMYTLFLLAKNNFGMMKSLPYVLVLLATEMRKVTLHMYIHKKEQTI